MNVTTTTDDRALIVTEFGKRVWKCPNCRKMIGEVVGCRLVIITHKRRLTYPLVVGLQQTCPDCGHESEYRAA